MKKIIIALCAFACVFSLTACEQKEQIQYDKQMLEVDKAISLRLFSVYAEDEAYDEMTNYSEFEWMELSNELKTNYGVVLEKSTMKSAVESYRSAISILGEMNENGETLYTIDGEKAVITVPLVGKTGREAKFVVMINEYNEITECQTDPIYTMGEKMSAAGINTLLGMGTVFLVLILISLIISCFQIIPILQKRVEDRRQKKKIGSEESIDATIAQIAEKEDVEDLDNTELVAVIAAAIAAYEGSASVDGFVVRSVRKVNTSNWNSNLK